MPLRRALLAILLLLPPGCGGSGVNWSDPENFVYREKSSKVENGVELDYASLVDAGCEPIFQALVDVEHYPDFVPGVDRVNLIDASPTSKTVQIAQRVIGRQSNAKVNWTFDKEKKTVEFTTVTSDLNFNDGRYTLEPSPDGKRCLVRTTFIVKEGEGRTQSVPIGVLAAGTRETFLAAARGIKKRASSPAQ